MLNIKRYKKTNKKPCKKRKTKKRRYILYFGGDTNLEKFKEDFKQLIENIKKKIQETPSYMDNPSEEESICNELYLEECQNIQKLFSNNLKYLNEPFISDSIYSIENEPAKLSLNNIYTSMLNDDIFPKETEIAISESSTTIIPPSIKELRLFLPIISMKEFWKDVINKINKKIHDQKQAKYRPEIRAPFIEHPIPLDEYRTSIKQLMTAEPEKICIILSKFIKYYSVNQGFNDKYNNVICLVFLLIGYITNLLFKSDTCAIIVKGGKAMQFYAPMPSNDIDITISPKEGDLEDTQIEIIGNHIVDFIIWVASYVYSSGDSAIQFSKITKGEGSAKIIKLSIKTEGQGYLPILDIGLGYNSLSTEIKKINKINKLSKIPYYEIENPKWNLRDYGFGHLNIENIILEKIYYIDKYLKEKDCSFANANYLKKTYYSLVIFMSQLLSLDKTMTLEKMSTLLVKCIKSVKPDFRIARTSDINSIITNFTNGMFVDRWLIWDGMINMYKGIFPDVVVMCMPDNTIIKLLNWTNHYTIVGNQFSSNVPQLTIHRL